MKVLISFGILIFLYNVLPEGWLIPVMFVLGTVSFLIGAVIAARKE